MKGNKEDIIHHDGETMSVRSTQTQTNSHIPMLTDTPLDGVPDVDSDNKNFLLVYHMDVFLVRRRRTASRLCVSAQHRRQFIGVISGVLLLVYREKFDNVKLFAKADKRAVSTERVAHFF